jgi:hypothetical protein
MLLDYKEKGYAAEFVGETKEGTECFKLKLTKPVTVNGVKMDDVFYYYFDTENYLPIVMKRNQTGTNEGQKSVSTMSDYQEVDGVYFPFSMNIEVKL